MQTSAFEHQLNIAVKKRNLQMNYLLPYYMNNKKNSMVVVNFRWRRNGGYMGNTSQVCSARRDQVGGQQIKSLPHQTGNRIRRRGGSHQMDRLHLVRARLSGPGRALHDPSKYRIESINSAAAAQMNNRSAYTVSSKSKSETH